MTIYLLAYHLTYLIYHCCREGCFRHMRWSLRRTMLLMSLILFSVANLRVQANLWVAGAFIYSLFPLVILGPVNINRIIIAWTMLTGLKLNQVPTLLIAGTKQTSLGKLPNPVTVSIVLIILLLTLQLMCLVHRGKWNKMRGCCVAGMYILKTRICKCKFWSYLSALVENVNYCLLIDSQK